MPSRTLVLLSCSRDKLPGGTPFDVDARSLASHGILPKLWREFLGARKEIFDLVHGLRGRLYDEDQKGGFRDERGANRALLLGPDLGGQVPGDTVYLPACRRYTGRFFEALNSGAPNFWKELPKHPIEILFVSGLYGLVLWNELIQNYDCHLNDYFEKQGQTRKVADLWKPLLTDVLCEFIETKGAQGRPIRDVFDLLSEELYQKVFDWDRLCSKAKVRVHHRVFKRLSGTDTLPCVAGILSTQLPRFYEESQRFKRGEWHGCPAKSGPSVEFSFEYPLGSDTGATREGEIDQAHESILLTYPEFSTLPREILEDLALAEHSWRKAESLKRFDFGALIVSYAKAVERWLRSALPNWQLEEKTMLQAVRGSSNFRPLTEDTSKLWDLRSKGGAHPGLKRTKDDVRQARQLALNILSQGVQIESRLKGHRRTGG